MKMPLVESGIFFILFVIYGVFFSPMIFDKGKNLFLVKKSLNFCEKVIDQPSKSCYYIKVAVGHQLITFKKVLTKAIAT